MKNKEFYVVIKRDEDGMYIGEVPQLKACYSQGETIDELITNIKEVIKMCLEELGEESITEFIGVSKVVLSSLNYQQLQEKN
ncbi:MAG: type II toxin-antitoxin system HicB family antitoxin [Sphaerospermopsis kisseleviana]|uniref:Type II toxin-antitoxin system HicB family antitoxin n=2 Tax=Sphaerospermopsis TaxID=752201 RepID=A0ABT4ZYZ8_9CYAN|nr:type II toxin-antitoxin system HicB family antitoxin [Sphaerospermopsis kisseleviana]MDB9444311.1 type II toxin-antitoxin system HicB family antitoxin [Sphaerospermopsis kisseleviana CS-549]